MDPLPKEAALRITTKDGNVDPHGFIIRIEDDHTTLEGGRLAHVHPFEALLKRFDRHSSGGNRDHQRNGSRDGPAFHMKLHNRILLQQHERMNLVEDDYLITLKPVIVRPSKLTSIATSSWE